MAMLGGVHLSTASDLHMEEAPSQLLGITWHFLLNKMALPFLSGVCNQKTNPPAATYLNQLFKDMRCHGDPSLADMTLPCLNFCHCFFDSSLSLMNGHWNLAISNGLHYAKTTVTIPNKISCWHFIPLMIIQTA